jgi:hypothetical protein
MYRAVVTIAGIYGTFPEGDPVAGIPELILKSWLDAGLIEEAPEPAPERAIEPAPQPTFEPAEDASEPKKTGKKA